MPTLLLALLPFAAFVLASLELTAQTQLEGQGSVESAPTEGERKKARDVLDAFDRLGEKLPQYVVLADVLLTVDDLKKKTTRSSEASYIQCIDRKLGVVRYDSLEPAFSSFDMVASTRRISAISKGKDFWWFQSGKLRTSLNLSDDLSEKEKEKIAVMKMVMFDPFYTSILGYDGFRSRGALQAKKPPFSRFSIKQVDEDIKLLGMELLVSEKFQLYLQIVFDTTLGGVPIESRLVPGSDRGSQMSLVSTKWGKFNSVPVPMEIVAFEILGSEKTGTKKTWEIRLHWSELPREQTAAHEFFSFGENQRLIVVPETLLEFVKSRTSSPR